VPEVKVLVVDDEQSILDLVTPYLRCEGYDVHIGHIRQKLGDGRFIVTIRGVGYRFDDQEA
jgi:DNA-binding response OmpR family regulator